MPINVTAKIQSSGPSSASAQSTPAPAAHHPTFFFDNTLIVIQIENILFNVHKYQLVKSKTFTDLFAAAERAKTEGKPVEGSSIENPIKLEGVSASDFGCLLTVLYATHFSTHQPDPEISLIFPAFRLATKWSFLELRAYLLPVAEKILGDADKVAFAREFDIKDWLAPAHINLCQRPTKLSIDEAKKLGINSVLMISSIREEFSTSNPSRNEAGSCYGTSVRCNSYGRDYNSRHCSCCPRVSGTALPAPPAPEVVSQLIQEKVKKWVENGCIMEPLEGLDTEPLLADIWDLPGQDCTGT